MKFELKYQPEKGGDWPFRCQRTPFGTTGLTDAKSWENWCGETFNNGTWYRDSGSLWFKNREDALMFIMRWA